MRSESWDAALPPPGSSCPRAGTERDAPPRRPHARRRSRQGGGIEQHVADVVVQEVDLVDIEDPAGWPRRADPARAPSLPHAARGRCRPEPATRSSVAFKGRSTTMHRRRTEASSPRATRSSNEGTAGRDGMNGQSATTSISGRSSARPRTAVDFPVLLGPLDEQAADGRIDRIDQERLFEALLVDDGCERVVPHGGRAAFRTSARPAGSARSAKSRSTARPCLG